jgi:hypothetical protein
MLMKLLTDITGSSESFGAPNVRLPAVVSFNVYSSQALVTGLSEIDPATVLLPLTQNRRRAWVTSLPVVPGGSVVKLNLRNVRPSRPFTLKTRKSIPLP